MKKISLMLILILPFNLMAFDHEHSKFSILLSEYVEIEGPKTSVNYTGLKENPKALDNYLKDLSQVRKSTYDQFTDDQKLSFLINAYNAFTIQLMRDNWPTDTIRDLGSIFSSPWKKEFFTLLGEERSLDWIEHEVIRKEFEEPRIHFAVNCASLSCPSLRAEAFIATKLDAQLEEQAKSFLNDPIKNKLVGKKAMLSKIFDWYGKDFTKKDKNLIRVLNKWRDIKFPESGEIGFLNYEWTPNSFEVKN